MKSYRGSRGLAPLNLNLGTRWRYVVNITPRPLYTKEGAQVLIEYEAGSAPESVSTFRRREEFLPLPVLKSCRLVAIPTADLKFKNQQPIFLIFFIFALFSVSPLK
jgi:hypothetical protein